MNDKVKEKSLKPKKFKIEYVIIIILALIAIYIFITSFDYSFSSGVKSTNEISESEYIDYLEDKLSKKLSEIDGAGSVTVLISTEGGMTEEVAVNTTTKTENGVKTVTETTVMVNGKPYVLRKLYPKIMGVVVITDGANNLSVKQNILECAITLLNVPASNINIIKRKS